MENEKAIEYTTVSNKSYVNPICDMCSISDVIVLSDLAWNWQKAGTPETCFGLNVPVGNNKRAMAKYGWNLHVTSFESQWRFYFFEGLWQRGNSQPYALSLAFWLS